MSFALSSDFNAMIQCAFSLAFASFDLTFDLLVAAANVSKKVRGHEGVSVLIYF